MLRLTLFSRFAPVAVDRSGSRRRFAADEAGPVTDTPGAHRAYGCDVSNEGGGSRKCIHPFFPVFVLSPVVGCTFRRNLNNPHLLCM